MLGTLTADTLKPGTNEKESGSVGNGLKEGDDNETQYPGIFPAVSDTECVSDSPRAILKVLCSKNGRKMVFDVGIISSTFDRIRNDCCLVWTKLLGPVDFDDKISLNIIIGFGFNSDGSPPYDPQSRV